jgi:ribonuclease HI
MVDAAITSDWLLELRGSQVGACYARTGQLAASDGSLLEDGKAGAGFAIMNGTRWRGPVPGKQTVFRGELAALTQCVSESKQTEELTVLVDSQAVLDVVRNCIRQLEPMDPTFHDDRDLITALIAALARRQAQTFLCKCKSHRGDPLNDAADAEAKAGAASSEPAADDHTNAIRFRYSIRGLGRTPGRQAHDLAPAGAHGFLHLFHDTSAE